MKLEMYTISKRGSKPNNEDYCDYINGSTGFFACLADGLGGHVGGKRASRIAVDAAIDSITQDNEDSGKILMLNAINSAQAKLIEKQKEIPRLDHMRTTFVGVFIDKAANACFAYSGDSRLYIIRNKQIYRQTQDQSMPQLLVSTGNISKDQIRGHVHRNHILHSLGDSNSYIVEQESDIELKNNDVVLLCSDGFWEYVLESDMIFCHSKLISAKKWLERLEEIVLTKTKGIDNDNYSALAVFIKGV